ncbi:hypothetical protein ABZ769_03150 [Streptomyces olivoreticuli]
MKRRDFVACSLAVVGTARVLTSPDALLAGVAVDPWTSTPATRRAVDTLRATGVRVLHGPGEWTPHPPGTGDGRRETYPWHLALDALTATP